GSKWFDQDQSELQRIATDIVKCCTPPPSSASSSSTLSSSVESKLSESKFIQLMRNISSGDVTLKKNADGNSASELFSSNNGELVGNRHIFVKDEIHKDILD
uniref:Peroxisomal membrane protein PEX21 n=1 Tax=Saccharomyces cerevisiae (strain ATCC 204508 / S288c) TaxID=559292 RepID=UPI0003527103|nr:Chain B, Peroxisomal membrane protein PEX21 [Saccharomyces cerevisiae S288C]